MTTNTAVATIEDTIRQALQRSGNGTYMSYAQPVVQALIEREQQISDELIDRAQQMGLEEREARIAVTSTGLSVRHSVEDEDDEPEDDDDDSDDEPGDGVADMLRRIDERLDSLTDFARRNGYRG